MEAEQVIDFVCPTQVAFLKWVKTDCTASEPIESVRLLWPSPSDILLTQLEYKAVGHTP